MADRASRHPSARARRAVGLRVSLLGLVLAIILPAVVLAATASVVFGAAGDPTPLQGRSGTIIDLTSASNDDVTLVAATSDATAASDATPAPGATPEPGDPGTGETAGWERTSDDPSALLAPLLLGAVVLVILVVFIAMSFAESPEARPTGR